ncbi:MAG: ATP-binding protein [Deltaproteobacteria bacterium]|jgi:hypothetical protein|nr:ATP-binding protein [Deltaproteobacteria bacterium]
MKLLPIGVADFATIRKREYIFADKTKLIYEFLNVDSPLFLSRPRRFGKSLLVSTLKAALLGQREIFKGLWIYDSDYNWEPNPVINLSLSSVKTDSPLSVENDLVAKLKNVAKNEGVSIEAPSVGQLFFELMNALYLKYDQKKVAILIDEYDAPILNKISQPELAKNIRDSLKSFYSALKDAEDYRGFTFITGVTKFTKTSLFSTLNNLKDLTLNENYANICGFTVEEFDSLFSESIEATLPKFIAKGYLPKDASAVDLRQLILDWYDGYSWDGITRVLNPWSTLNCFDQIALDSYWSESGVPTFLVELIQKSRLVFDFLKPDKTITNSLNVVDVGRFEPLVLAFQAGYLTIQTDSAPVAGKFYLQFPNLDVKASLIPLLLFHKDNLIDKKLIFDQAKAILASIIAKDAPGLEMAFGSFLANIPYSLHLNYEAYYHTIFIFAMALAGQEVDIQGEVGEGKFDAHLKAKNGDVFVIELKYARVDEMGKPPNDPAKEAAWLRRKLRGLTTKALAQIEEKKYDLKFKGSGNRIFKTAIVFSERTDVMAAFKEAKNWVLVKEPGGVFKVKKV